MTETEPEDEYQVYAGDYVLVELSNGKQFSGEVTDIEDGIATIKDYTEDGAVAAQLEVPVDRCRLHPQGRNMASRLRVKVVDHDSGSDWLFVADFVGIVGLGGLIIFAIILIAAASVFFLSSQIHRWVVISGMVAITGVLSWQVWTGYKVIKRKQQRDVG